MAVNWDKIDRWHPNRFNNNLGDDEGFNMVSAIGAYFKTKRSENDSPASLYPTVFSTPNPVDSERVVEKEQQKKIIELQQLIDEQNEKIEAQAQLIQELRDLSTKLIEYHEQISRKSDEDRNKILTDVKDGKDQDLLAKLSFENQTLGKKLRSQLDFILNLELQCTSLRRQLKKSERLNEIKETDKSSFDNISQKPLKEESEGDSAFDEKISSRSVSGRSSVAFATSNYKSVSVPRGFGGSKSPSLLKSIPSNKDEEPKSIDDKSVSNCVAKNFLPISAPVFKDLNSFHIDNAVNDTLRCKENDSLSFISDLTSNSNNSNKYHSLVRKEENRSIQFNNKFSTIENDKFLPALRYQYLESTHVDKGQKTGRVSPSFSLPLKEIEMFSGDDSDETRVKPFSTSISCDNM